MLQRLCCIAVIAVLFLWVPAQANTAALEVEGSILHTGKSGTEGIIPHFSENPGSGIGVLIRHPVGIPNGGLTVGIHGVYTHHYPWNSYMDQGDEKGHTAAFVAVSRDFGMVRLSAQEMYMHKNASNKIGFFQDDTYETLLKAEFSVSGSNKQKPYIFTGLITPAYIPIQEAIGIGGIGFATHTPIAIQHLHAAFRTDSYIATTLFHINREQEMMTKNRVGLEIHFPNLTKVQTGINLFHDIQRKEYSVWWDVAASYTF